MTGIAIFIITDRNAKLPWYTDFAGSYNKAAAFFYLPVAKKVADIPIGLYSGVFLCLSAIAHLLVVLPGLHNVYNQYLAINQNFFRWFEYSLSAAVMHVMIAQLSGVTEIHLLFAIFGLSSSTMFYGWLMERTNGQRIPTYTLSDNGGEAPTQQRPYERQLISDAYPSSTSKNDEKVDWTPFLLGFIPHFYCWAIIFCYFFVGAKQSSPPAFVWAIIFVVFGLDLLFAVNQLLQFLQVKGWRGFAAGEFYYIILSITAKQLLAWINYGGTLRFKN